MIKFPKQIRHYKLGAELGRGNFSVVCIATDINSEPVDSSNQNPNHKSFSRKPPISRKFACKVFPKSNLREEGDVERFQREINTMTVAKHPSLVTMHDFFSDESNFYLILDLCQGGELYDYIVNHDKLNEIAASVVFSQIVDALGYCHSIGIAHRDLKPENVLITNFPNIKISDFGLCGLISETKLMTSFCGSPCYCSPECLSKLDYDGRKSDIWSLGVLLYTMVTGQIPWNILNTKMMLEQICTGTYPLPENLSEDCRDLISHLLVVNPDERLTIDQIQHHSFLSKGNFSIYQCNQPFSTGSLVQSYANSQLVLPRHDHILPTNHNKTKSTTLSEIPESQTSPKESSLGVVSPFAQKSVLNLPKGVPFIKNAKPANSNSSRADSRQTKIQLNWANSRYLIGKRRNTIGSGLNSISPLVVKTTKLPPLS